MMLWMTHFFPEEWWAELQKTALARHARPHVD